MPFSARVSWRQCVSSLALLSLIACAGACGTSTSSTAPTSSNATAGGVRAQPVVAHAERRQLDGFAMLRTRPEGLPARTRRVLRAPILGTNWRLAQRIPVALPGAYWLLPGKRHLCIAAETDETGVGTTCARTSQAVAHGLASVTIAPAAPGTGAAPARLIVGVAPDGARAVRVHTGGAVASVPVVDHVFVLRDRLSAPPDVLTLR